MNSSTYWETTFEEDSVELSLNESFSGVLPDDVISWRLRDAVRFDVSKELE